METTVMFVNSPRNGWFVHTDGNLYLHRKTNQWQDYATHKDSSDFLFPTLKKAKKAFLKVESNISG